PVVAVAFPITSRGPTPWDRLALVSLVGDKFAFNLLHNYSYYVNGTQTGSPAGYLALVSCRGVPNAPLEGPEDAAIARALQDLELMFPDVRQYIDPDEGRMQRWIGLPKFAPGFIGRRSALREATGRVRYCGDYTAEPGLAGAARSGRAVGRSLA